MLLARTTIQQSVRHTTRNVGVLPVNTQFSRQMRTQTVDLASDRYEPSESATRPPLVILHGLLGSKQNWRSLGKSFANKFKCSVHCLDLRNHGASPHAQDTSYPAMAADVAQYLENEDLENVFLMGHSMGGKVAMTLALSFPDAVEKLISADIGPNVGRIGQENFTYLEVMKKIDEKRVKSKKEADHILQEYEPNLIIRQFLLTNLVKRSDGSDTFTWRVALDNIHKGLLDLGDFPFSQEATVKYTKPSLFIRGGKSNYVNPNVVKKAEAFFPNMELETIQDAGHWVHAEKPVEFTKILEDFLTKEHK